MELILKIIVIVASLSAFVFVLRKIDPPEEAQKRREQNRMSGIFWED